MRKLSAVCAGINNYPGSGSDLAGCVNDKRDWESALLRRGYSVLGVEDSDATKQNLILAIRESLVKLKFGDRFVFTFSGHGTWVPDRDGDEADQRDEALCCYDYSAGGLFTDDEMHAIFQERALGVRVTIISDSCHSGTISRLMSRAVAPRPKFLPPTKFSDITEDQAARVEATTRNAKPRPGTILISGCADHEYSYDAYFDGRPNGAMSYFALKALEQATTVKNVYALLRGSLPNLQYPQTPQLAATSWQKRTFLL